MTNNCTIKAPFFEIGPKSYLYGQDVIDLAIAADKASENSALISFSPAPSWRSPA